MNAAVAVEGLSKRYTLGSGGGYRRLTEVLSDRFRSDRSASARGEFWALREVSFEVGVGEVVGIIGRNGAGKSTLLKILSRITEPTAGRAVLNGRVGSLLEVGTGFHPELTGRENIFLNGAVLGMRKAEIDRQFDAIVDFAEIDRFLDTPVKRYSSGMYVRLAFAVAAHLEPEILIVDEVLAVGDSAFQKKCLGKMGDVARGGRTVLFVSHNMAAIRNLCTRSVLLDSGVVAAVGPTEAVLTSYLTTAQPSPLDLATRTDRKGTGKVRVRSIATARGTDGEDQGVLICGEPGQLTVVLETDERLEGLRMALAISSETHGPILQLDSALSGDELAIGRGSSTATCSLSPVPLMPGRYLANIYVERNGILLDWVQEACLLDVVEGDFYGTGKLPPPGYGSVIVPFKWTSAQ